MKQKEKKADNPKAKKPNIFEVLKPYKGLLAGLLIFAVLSNALNLVIPKIIQNAIDSFSEGHFDMNRILIWFSVAAIFIFIFTYLQSIVQTYASEKVARNLRERLAEKISRQTYRFVQDADPNKLLTNLTSDVDAIKSFVSQAIVSLVSSVVLIIGAAILLIGINWRLGLTVLLVLPIITITFALIFKKVKFLFNKSQEVLDRLNKVINESILGAALIRILNAQSTEYDKFLKESGEAKNLGLAILRLFALLIPIIVFTANLARLAVLAMGGHFVISGSMSLGEFAAFNSYIAILIFPILVIGFMSTIIARASASYARIHSVLNAEDSNQGGDVEKRLGGRIEVKNLSLEIDKKQVLKNLNFDIQAHTKTAIIGPTAAGKTQLFYALTTLIRPQEGQINYDYISLEQYNQQSLLRQIGLVFQDAVMFSMSLRENIAFNADVSEKDLQKAIDTAELKDLVDNLPDGLDTVLSERGTTLSGGQKQRIMLARALAGNPTILLLDEFTARVDRQTEQKILNNLFKNYPEITLVSITQSLVPVKDYDQIILLMEGEIIAKGKHEELMSSCPEYVQIYQSQQSTNVYETENA